MKRDLALPVKILTGICALAVSSFSQTYTVSAKPGAVNYIQGDVAVNGDPVWTSNLKTTFLNANDVIAVKNGKAEVLLTPGVFLRVGENSEVRMINPSLIETRIEVLSGESMLEVDDLVPGSSVVVMDHGSATTLIKPGLYRFTEQRIATLDGKAEVQVDGRKVDLKKNKEVELGDNLVAKKVDQSQGDDLYAWSNQRAQYNAAATYAGSRAAYDAGGYGFSSFSSPGWYWNSPFNAYMWMPANGAFYSPFGWGFYGPGLVAYAPVMAVPYSGYGYGYGNGYGYGTGMGPIKLPPIKTTLLGTPKPPPIVHVPINPRNVPVTNFQGTSPAAFAAARMQMQQNYAYYGPRNASGAPAAQFRNGQTFSSMHAASQAAAANARAASASSSSGFGGSAAGNAGWSGGNSGSNSGWSGGRGASSTSRGGGSGGPSSMSRGGGSGTVRGK